MPVHRLSVTQFQDWLVRARPDIEHAVIRGLRGGALMLERQVVEEIEEVEAVDTGEMKQSVSTERVDDGAIVAVKAPHAAPMEYGTRPFTPPFEPIYEWVKRKGLGRMIGPQQRIKRGRRTAFEESGDEGRPSRRAMYGPVFREKAYQENRHDDNAKRVAWAVIAAIQKNGIKPRHYFRSAWEKIEPRVPLEVYRELSKLPYGRVR